MKIDPLTHEARPDSQSVGSGVLENIRETNGHRVAVGAAGLHPPPRAQQTQSPEPATVVGVGVASSTVVIRRTVRRLSDDLEETVRIPERERPFRWRRKKVSYLAFVAALLFGGAFSLFGRRLVSAQHGTVSRFVGVQPDSGGNVRDENLPMTPDASRIEAPRLADTLPPDRPAQTPEAKQASVGPAPSAFLNRRPGANVRDEVRRVRSARDNAPVHVPAEEVSTPKDFKWTYED
jgi:hypothetical protein